MKKTVYKSLLMALIIGSVGGATSCTDLDETLYSDLNETNIDLSNEADMQALMGQAIAQYRYFQLSWFGSWELNEQCTDQYCVPYRIGIGWGDLYVNLHKHNWNYNVGHAENIWLYAYKCIGYCNNCLDHLPESRTEDRAQMRFFRAMTYYQLLDYFRNIPLLTTMDTPAGYLPEQSNAQQVFEFVVSELEAIKEDLGTTKYYAWGNKYVACMALAKLYLNKNVYLDGLVTPDNTGYEHALAEVNTIINEGGYELSASYSDNFKIDLSTNKEVIFAVPQDKTHASHFGLDCYCFSNTGKQAYGFTTNCTNGSAAIPQWIDTYADTDHRLTDTWIGGGWLQGGTFHFDTRYAGILQSDGYQRMYTTDGGSNSGDPLPFADDDWTGTGMLVYNKEIHSMDNPGAYQQEGYRMVKFEFDPSAGTHATDIVIFRYADALMIKAECLLRLGQDKETAAQLVTEVRKRSFDNLSDATRTVADLEGGSVYAYGHRECTDSNCKTFSTWTKTNEGGSDIILGGLLDDLGWEFCGEQHRRQDLIRFQMTDGRNVFNGKSWFCKDATTETHWNIFPIPKLALEANIKMQQNPGYSGAESDSASTAD